MEDSYVLQLSDRKFSDLYLCFCGYAKCDPLHSFGPAVRPNYLIHYILKGKGKYTVGADQHKLQSGQGFLIEPEIQTFYQADAEDPWTYLWIGFDGKRAKEYLKDIGLGNGQLIFHSSKGPELKALIVNMLKHNSITTTNQFLLESGLYTFFLSLPKTSNCRQAPDEAWKIYISARLWSLFKITTTTALKYPISQIMFVLTEAISICCFRRHYISLPRIIWPIIVLPGQQSF